MNPFPPTRARAVELLRPVDVFDPESDAAYVWFHRYTSLSHRMTLIRFEMNQHDKRNNL